MVVGIVLPRAGLGPKTLGAILMADIPARDLSAAGGHVDRRVLALAATSLAAYLPSRCAARVDPGETLRAEA